MAQVLRNKRLANSLIGKPALDWDELLEASKELYRRPYKGRRGEHYEGRRKKLYEGRRGDRGRPLNSYTPLKTTRTQALMIIEKSEHLRWPAKMRESENRQRSSKYYNFHQDCGHTTQKCFHLKKELERLIQMGQLKYLVRPVGGMSPAKGKRKEAPEVWPRKGEREAEVENWHRGRVVNVIERGSYGGTTKSSRKRHMRKITGVVLVGSCARKGESADSGGKRKSFPIERMNPKDEVQVAILDPEVPDKQSVPVSLRMGAGRY
ncbi:hypothetical protein Salat_1853900 [Sesamum alatum]|uniref:Uncharacterized protein n=1 Tax=Sesamum alatum TaxID=300844 RepID=A0AAE1Y3U0_9LAMI|nr:hypothetical protein Salat_1853900 [Sesamum alatum]